MPAKLCHKQTHVSMGSCQACSPAVYDPFPVMPALLDAVVEAMHTWGYDQSQPVMVWEAGQALMDGHTRLKAAVQAGFEDVPVYCKSFETEDEALHYAIHLQRQRRNLTDAGIIRCIEALDRRKRQGEDQAREKGRFQPRFLQKWFILSS
jgi:hypothetical protein